MKSKKADDYLNAHVVNLYDYKPMSRFAAYAVRFTSAIRAVELAEQEAEERVRAELTRWHDPKEELPEPKQHVLVKYAVGFYSVDLYDPELGRFLGEDDFYVKVIGWREIHE